MGKTTAKKKKFRICLKMYIIEMRYTNNWMIQGTDGELVRLTICLRTFSKEAKHGQQCLI